MKNYTIEVFAKIDDVVHSTSGKEARDKAYELASLWVNGIFSIPSVKEFESIIKIKEVE